MPPKGQTLPLSPIPSSPATRHILGSCDSMSPGTSGFAQGIRIREVTPAGSRASATLARFASQFSTRRRVLSVANCDLKAMQAQAIAASTSARPSRATGGATYDAAANTSGTA
jgi:hypothetical protein